MENMQKQIDALRGDVDQVIDKLDHVLKILANLSLPSRVDATTVGANPPIGSPLSKVIWHSFGPSSEYTSAVAQDTQEPMGTNTEFPIGQPRTHQVQPRLAMPQSLEDPKNAHQGDNSKGKSVVSPSEETRQKFKAIEDKLRMMESFLPNNVSPPYSHSRSTVSARTPCFNHQYPTVVQPQHQPPLKEQHQPLLIEQPQPFFIKQPQHQPLLIEQHQPFLIKQPQPQPLLIEQSQPFLIKQPQPQPLLIEQPQPFLIKQPQPQPLLIEQSQPFLIKQPQPQPLLIEQPQPFLIKQP
ncbi:hypothetical protein QL285_015644 [Trifolium repens]|nr:hypothetical protein QL285_015644 [Trifolium repens]